MPKIAYIYLFKIQTTTDTYLKIGVTTRGIQHREYELKCSITDVLDITLLDVVQDSGINILKKESLILNTFKKFVCKNKFAGSTELLDINTDQNLIKEIMNENI